MVRTFLFNDIQYQSGTLSHLRTRHNVNLLKIDECRNTSLLVSKKYFQKFFEGRKNFNGLIKHLLEESSSTLIFGFQTEKRSNLARKYQSKGLELIKISCRIEESLLVELELLSQFFRISRCRLVAMMLELKELGWLRLMRLYGIVRGTTTPEKLSFTLTIYPRPNPSFVASISEITNDS